MLKTTDLRLSLPRHPTKTYNKRDLGEILGIAVHCDDAGWDPFKLAEYDIGPNHIDFTGCPAVTYHTFVGQTGIAYQMLDFEEVSWHAKGWNTQLVACCLSYRATGAKSGLPDAQYQALVPLLAKMLLFLGLDPTEGRIYGHRELEGTGHKKVNEKIQYIKECPGWKVDLPQLRSDVCEEVQREIGTDPDGDWGPLSKKAFADYQFSGEFNG